MPSWRALLGGRRPAAAPQPEAPRRIVAAASPQPRAELAVVALLCCCAACAVGFILVYALPAIPATTQLLGLSLGLAFLCLALALGIAGRRLVADEEVEHDYPPFEHTRAVDEVVEIVRAGGERFTRRRLVTAAGAVAGGTLGVALLAPLASFGPVFDLRAFVATPWYRGRRLVDESGAPLQASAIEQADFYTAYPEGADREQLGAPLILVRLPLAQIHLPPGRAGWAPGGILAYSKICTHAGCAISLYRKPTFPAVEPGPAFVCPCHYSTFDPATGGTVLFGPAGRPLPQLPLAVAAGGALVAGGTFSGPVGPAWWGVRSRRPT